MKLSPPPPAVMTAIFCPLKTEAMKSETQSPLQQPSSAACVWQPRTFEVGMALHNLTLV
jgi:hypothetical protein